MRTVLAVVARAASWLLRPPDFQPCMWANLTDGDES